MSSAPRMNTLFRIQTIFALKENPMSGYDLAKRLEEISGKKPSSGKIYPFLSQLKENSYIKETDIDDDSDRDRTVYILTNKGEELLSEVLERMDTLLEARMNEMTKSCKSCGVKIVQSSIEGRDKGGNIAYYCCEHCKANYYDQYKIKE